MTLSTAPDENVTTRERIRLAMEEVREMEKRRNADHNDLVQRVKALAEAIDRRDHRNVSFWVKVWVWVKKVLSVAHSEAEKIRLEENDGDR